MRILTFSPYYLPGYKAGGPIRTLSGMVDRLGNDHQFQIVTSDRDSGDTRPYPGIAADAWQAVGNAQVHYLSPRNRSLAAIRRLLGRTEYDILYINSFFSSVFGMQPLALHWLGAVKRVPVVVAPRGQFSDGALGLKSAKKRPVLTLARQMSRSARLLWHASSEYEERDIRRQFGADARIVVAPNLAAVPLAERRSEQRIPKRPGHLRVLFLARVVRMKNLDAALRILSEFSGSVELTIHGPREDADYWLECERLIQQLPANIQTRYLGQVAHDEVAETMAGYDLYLLPTRGENFGHAILEALSAGCPVLISDRTPWRGLRERGVGWDLPLETPEAWLSALQECLAMDASEHASWSDRAREFGMRWAKDDHIVQQNRALFATALGRSEQTLIAQPVPAGELVQRG